MELFDDRMIAPMRWLQKKKLYADIVAKGGSSHSLLRASGSKSSLSSLANSCSESMETEGPGCWLNQAAHAVVSPSCPICVTA